MKNEIRNLQAGVYASEDNSAFIAIHRIDGGVIIELADAEFDLYQRWILDDGKTVEFCWDSLENFETGNNKENEV